MDTIQVNIANKPYPIYIGDSIFENFSGILNEHFLSGQIAIITTESIFKLHGNKLKKQLE